jgi:hypothetical protein
MLLSRGNGEYPGDYTIVRVRERLGVGLGRGGRIGLTHRRKLAQMIRRRMLIGVVAVMLLSPLSPVMANAAGITVGVVDFYALTPLGAFVGLVPERFSAEDLSRLLARAAAERFAVVPSGTMQRAEDAMHWQSADVLHFDRLRALARAVGADRLVVGWIPLFSVDATGGGAGFPRATEGEGPPTATVNIVVQVFDQAAGRLVAETKQSASVLGATRSQAAGLVLHVALERALPDVLRLLVAQAP